MNAKAKDPTPPPPPQSKKVSPAILAARAFNRIDALIKQRDAELANAPESITKRFAEKIRVQRLPLGIEARELLDGMLESAGHTEALTPADPGKDGGA